MHCVYAHLISYHCEVSVYNDPHFAGKEAGAERQGRLQLSRRAAESLLSIILLSCLSPTCITVKKVKINLKNMLQ